MDLQEELKKIDDDTCSQCKNFNEDVSWCCFNLRTTRAMCKACGNFSKKIKNKACILEENDVL